MEKNTNKKFLSKSDVKIAEKYENQKNIFDLVENWLERTPFIESEEFSFWESYKNAIGEMLEHDMKIINQNPNLDEESKNDQINHYKKIYKNYNSLFDENKYNYIRKRTLDIGNEAIRDFEKNMEKLDISLKKENNNELKEN